MDAVAMLKRILKADAGEDEEDKKKKEEEDAAKKKEGEDKEDESKLKFEKGDEDDKDDDDKDDKKKDDGDKYDDKYMKKYMKKFMRQNPDYMSQMGKAKTDIDAEHDLASKNGDLQAEATMIDGTEIFKSFKTMSANFLKAVVAFDERLSRIEKNLVFNNEVASLSGEILIKASETIDQMASMPAPLRARLAAQTMQKAKSETADGEKAETVFQKALSLGFSGSKKVLMKAVMDGNSEAGRVLTQVESCFGNLSLLPPTSLRLIADLAPKE